MESKKTVKLPAEVQKDLKERCKRAGRGPWVMDLACLFGTMSGGPVGGKVRRKETRGDKRNIVEK